MRVRVTAASLLLCAAVLIFVFQPFTPAMPRAGFDPSWVAVMGEAADRPARWGVDTMFTYGPASPLVTGYYNAAFFTRTLPLLVGFAALFGWCAAAAGRAESAAGGGSRHRGTGSDDLGGARNDPMRCFSACPF